MAEELVDLERTSAKLASKGDAVALERLDLLRGPNSGTITHDGILVLDLELFGEQGPAEALGYGDGYIPRAYAEHARVWIGRGRERRPGGGLGEDREQEEQGASEGGAHGEGVHFGAGRLGTITEGWPGSSALLLG